MKKLKQFKKKIKFYLAVSFIISLVIMLRVAIKEGNLVCGLYYKPAPCPIIPWLIQLIIFTIVISIILTLLIYAVKIILKHIPEIKKLGKAKPKKVKEEKKQSAPAASRKETKIAGKEEKSKKKEEIIRI